MWAAYQRLIKARPLATNIATAAVVMFTGDTTAQIIESMRSKRRRSEDLAINIPPHDDESSRESVLDSAREFFRTEFDVCRSVGMVSWNSLIFSPFFLVWFRYLDKHFSSSVRGCLGKAVVNGLVRARSFRFETVASCAVGLLA